MRLLRRTDPDPTVTEALAAVPAREWADDADQWRGRAEVAEAERDNEYAAACELGARLAQAEAERDTAQAQLAAYLRNTPTLPQLNPGAPAVDVAEVAAWCHDAVAAELGIDPAPTAPYPPLTGSADDYVGSAGD